MDKNPEFLISDWKESQVYLKCVAFDASWAYKHIDPSEDYGDHRTNISGDYGEGRTV